VLVRSDIRASDADRDRVVEALRDHAAVGRLTTEELEERTDRALAAKTAGELNRLLYDLPRLAPSRWNRALREAAWRTYEVHLKVYLVVTAVFVVLWAVGGMGDFWPIWPALGWGIGVACHRKCLPQRLPPAKQPRVIARA
jgi:hypothetical protein